MCGIAGVFGPETQENDLDLMLARLVHRGPDDHGKCLHNSARLGHARLSIIDVDGGRQPLFNDQISLFRKKPVCANKYQANPDSCVYVRGAGIHRASVRRSWVTWTSNLRQCAWNFN